MVRRGVSLYRLAAIEDALGRFETAHRGRRKGRGAAVAAASREIRYWRTRRASAEVVKPTDRSRTSFGMTVTLRRRDGREQSFRIVGEDEADPSRGTVSYVSPLARALLNRVAGETVDRRPGGPLAGRAV
jgi:transcription elongation GreA/GreB family factor